MLSKRHRVSRDALTKLHGVQTRQITGRFINLSCYKTPGLARFSFRVSKKIARTAVERNRLRRSGYHAVENRQDIIPAGAIYIFFLKKDAVTAPADALRAEIQKLLQKAGEI